MRVRIHGLFVLACVAGMASCSEPEVVPTSGPHAALKMSDVKVYQTQPAKYERLETLVVPVPSTAHWEATADGTKALDSLRDMAAAKGANGLLLIDNTMQNYAQAGLLYQGRSYLIPVRKEPLSVVAQAIFVVKE